MAKLKVKELNINTLIENMYRILSTKFQWQDSFNPFAQSGVIADAYLGRSGNKLASPYICKLMKSLPETGVYSEASYLICDKYARQWKRLIDDMLVEYDPAYDTNRNEVETVESSQSSTSSQSDNGNSKDFTRGFNSSSDVPAGSNQVESTSNGSASGTGNSRRELNIKANSALKTQAEVLEIDAKFWQNFNLYEIIFNDIDEELTFELYDNDDLEEMEGEIYG